MRYFSGVIYVPILKLVTLTKSTTFEHSVKFFKIFDPYSINCSSTIHEPFSAHNQWTSLSDVGDHLCLGITFSGKIESSELSENLKISEFKLLAKCMCTTLSMSTY